MTLLYLQTVDEVHSVDVLYSVVFMLEMRLKLSRNFHQFFHSNNHHTLGKSLEGIVTNAPCMQDHQSPHLWITLLLIHI